MLPKYPIVTESMIDDLINAEPAPASTPIMGATDSQVKQAVSKLVDHAEVLYAEALRLRALIRGEG